MFNISAVHDGPDAPGDDRDGVGGRGRGLPAPAPRLGTLPGRD